MKKENIALGLSGIAIVISIIAICVVCPHKAELGFDYQGIIVAILSLLVTILLGWQIYNAIYIKESLKKEVEVSLKGMVALERINLLKSQLNTLYGLHEGALIAGDINYMMSTLDIMMDIAIDLNDKVIADRIINKIPKLYDIMSMLELKKEQKNKYNELRQKIKEFSKITELAFSIYESSKAI